MSQQMQIDPQTYASVENAGLDAYAEAEMARFDDLTAEAGELRERADQLSKIAQSILVENAEVRGIWMKRR